MTDVPHEGEDPDVARAEELLDRWTARVTGMVQQAVGRAREEVEDVWAEAKHVRDRTRAPAGNP